ncbi:MAG: hypothetical protein ABIO57_03165 [Candidatus Paceibacterota bacterium]
MIVELLVLSMFGVAMLGSSLFYFFKVSRTSTAYGAYLQKNTAELWIFAIVTILGAASFLFLFYAIKIFDTKSDPTQVLQPMIIIYALVYMIDYLIAATRYTKIT